jgi:hypothetical protein
MFWTLAKPLAEFEANKEMAGLASEAWRLYLKTGTLTPGQCKAGAANFAQDLIEFLSTPQADQNKNKQMLSGTWPSIWG